MQSNHTSAAPAVAGSRSTPRLWLALMLPLALLAGACGGQSDDVDEQGAEGSDSTPEPEGSATDSGDGLTSDGLTAERLLGFWVKTADEPCAFDYPDNLTFIPFGYLTSTHDDRAPVLDGGEFQVVDGSRLLLSNPIGALVAYEADLSDGILTLVAESDGCTITYRFDGNQPTG